MTRSPPRRLLACLLVAGTAAAGTTVLTPVRGVAAEGDAVRTPLRVSVETLAPATIPPRGRVTITGRVTNRSRDTWTSLNAYLLTSEAPITTRSELAEAAASEPDSQIGVRRTAPGLYDEIGDLKPGESAPYRISVRRKDLGITGEPGVYWVGVHVLGALDGVRDTLADGRARTFMPLLPPTGTAAGVQARTRLSLVVPVKKPVRRGAAGRLLDVDAWNRSLGTDGRLDRLLGLSGRATKPITWVVDPAVLDAVRSIALGNPILDPAPGETGGPTETPSGEPSAGESDSADGSSPSASPDSNDATSDESSAEAATARAWLVEFGRQAATRTVASVPYGDLDVASVLASPASSVYQRALVLSDQTLGGYGIENAVPVVDPPTGYLPETALNRVGTETPVILDKKAFPRATGPVVASDGGPPVVLTDTEAGAGGPRPNSQYAALAFRQRLLSDAALHALSPDRDVPMVVTTPAYWNPGDAWASSGFFGGLDQPWLQLVDLPSIVATAPTAAGADPGAPVYPDADGVAQVPLSNLLATRELARTGGIFARLLTDDDTIDDRLARVALLGSSITVRGNPDRARDLTTSTTSYVRDQMDDVRVEGPPFVMMSGESGPIQVTLVNGLAQRVTVGLTVSTPGSKLRIAKVDPVTLGPGRRTSIRLEARSDDIGVHSVRLLATDADGVPLGSEAQFSVRTSHVSTVIWVIMAIGGILLFLAIAVRLYRRIRRRQATHGPLLRSRVDA